MAEDKKERVQSKDNKKNIQSKDDRENKQDKRPKNKKKRILKWIIGIILAFAIAITISLLNPAPEEDTTAKWLKSDISSALSLDGFDNENNIGVIRLNDSEELDENLSACFGDKKYIIYIGLDLTNKLNGVISGSVANEYNWALDGVYTTLDRIFNPDKLLSTESVLKDGAIVSILVKYTPKDTLDSYGNTIKSEEISLGEFHLCSTVASKINWKGMDRKKLEPLLIINWRGPEKEGSLDKLEKALLGLLN